MESIGKKGHTTDLFTPINLDLQCVLFVKSRPPVEPVDFVHRICEDIASNGGQRKSRYLNRLIPMTSIGKATEKGLEEVGRTVLVDFFQLTNKERIDSAAENGEEVAGKEGKEGTEGSEGKEDGDGPGESRSAAAFTVSFLCTCRIEPEAGGILEIDGRRWAFAESLESVVV